jgi:hypothetical protein
MQRLVLAIALVLFPSAAFAQIVGDQDDGTPPSPPPTPTPEPEPPPPPPPPTETRIAPAVEPEPEPGPPMASPRVIRPESNSIAIGLGWDLPADVQAPNVTSVRFRLPSGLTFEPIVQFARGASQVDDGVPPDVETTTTQLELSLFGRLPILQNGRVDFELVGGAGLARTVINPDMADNDTTRTGIFVGYGLAVGYWFSPHVYLTLTGLNPIFASSTEVEEQGPTTTIETSSSSIGLVFDPNVFVMVHLYL